MDKTSLGCAVFRTSGAKPVRFYNSAGLTILLLIRNEFDFKIEDIGLSEGTVVVMDSEVIIYPGVEFVAIFASKSEISGLEEYKHD